MLRTANAIPVLHESGDRFVAEFVTIRRGHASRRPKSYDFSYILTSSVVALLLVSAALFAGPNATAVLADDGSQLAVFVMNADGTDVRKLAQAPGKRAHAAPSWSSDGKLVVFHAYPKDSSTPDSHVFSVKDDGSDLKDLGAGALATWSPDNKQLLFSMDDQNPEKAQAGVWVMNADGKGRQFLFPGTAPVFASDGSRVLYVSSHEGNQSIYSYDVIEGMPKKILQETYQKRPGSARWSPDGKRVAFVDERAGKIELYLIDAAGSEKGQTMRHRGLLGGLVAWAPNAKLLVSSKEKDMNDPQRLCTLAPDGDDSPVLVPNQDAGKLNFDPAWSPDGKRIVFISDREK
jgi:Tol biopolymer transport system component